MGSKRIETLYSRYGKSCFKEWGKLGAKKLWENYRKMPVGIGSYILVKKENVK